MIQTITILSNGSFSPNSVIALGNKYENVGDTLVFNIPSEYGRAHSYAYYLTFKMPKHDIILLPVNIVNNVLTFFITYAVTQYAGTYEMVFLATETAIVDNNIDEAGVVFVSNVMTGVVANNFLTNPVTNEELDENLQTVYDNLMSLYNTVEEKLEDDEFVGPYYYPTVNDGIISWARYKTTSVQPPLPQPVDIRGPRGWTGNYYKPTIASCIISWTGYKYDSQSGGYIVDPGADPVADYNFEQDLVDAVNTKCDVALPSLVEAAVNARIRFEYDVETQTLYIYDVEAIENDGE